MVMSWNDPTADPKQDFETNRAKTAFKGAIQLLHKAQFILGQNSLGVFNHFSADYQAGETSSQTLLVH